MRGGLANLEPIIVSNIVTYAIPLLQGYRVFLLE